MNAKNWLQKRLIKEIINNTKQANIKNKIFGSILIAFYFGINVSNLLANPIITKYFESNIIFFRILTIISIIVEPLIISFYFLKIKLNLTKSIRLQFLVEGLKKILNFLICNLNLIKFWVYFPFKLVIVSTYISSKTIRANLYKSNYGFYIFNFAFVSELLFSFWIILMQLSIDKPIDPKIDSFFTKISGKFEQVFCIGTLIAVVLNAVDNGGMFSDVRTVQYTILFLQLLNFFGVNWVYFKELPFLDEYTERVFGVLLPNCALFLAVFGLSDQNWNTTTMFMLIMAPFSIFSSLYYIKNLYWSNTLWLLDNQINVALKKIFAKEKNDLMKKLRKMDLAIYRGSRARYAWRKKLSKTLDDKIHKKISIDKEFDLLVLNRFKQHQKTSNYGRFIKIVWMLENDPSISRILHVLNQMVASSGKSFYSKFLYQCAKLRIEEDFKRVYWSSRNDSFVKQKENRFFKVDEELEKLNKVGVDLAYAFKYKRELSVLTKLINEYTGINKQFISMLKTQSRTLKDLNKLCSKLYKLHRKILKQFHFLHKISRETEIIHLGPYFVYLIKCANLHRKASDVIKIYKKRIINSKNLVDSSIEFMDSNIFKDSIILKMESFEKGFGTILDVYGNLRLLKHRGLTERNLLRKNFNSLIIKSHQKAHYHACRVDLNRSPSSILGKNKFSFIQIPNSDKVIPAITLVKFIPFSKYDFKFAVGLKFLKDDSNMYIVLDSDDNVDVFSYNLKYQFDGEDELLTRGLNIYEMSPKIGEKLKRFREEGDIGSESKENEDGASFAIENSVDLRSNATNRDQEVFGGRRKEFRADIEFRDLSGYKRVSKSFYVEIVKREYSKADYSYHILILRNDSQAANRHKKNKAANANTNSNSVFSSGKHLRVNNDVESSAFESEEETENLLGSDRKKGVIRVQKIDDKINDSLMGIIEDSRDHRNYSESFDDDDNDSVQNFGLDKDHVGTGSVFSTVSALQNQKKFIAFEDALEKKPGFGMILLMFFCYLVCLVTTFYCNVSLGSGLILASNKFTLFSDLSTVIHEHKFEVEMFYSKMLIGIAKEQGLVNSNRYEGFDLEVNRAPLSPDLEVGGEESSADGQSQGTIQGREPSVRVLEGLWRLLQGSEDQQEEIPVIDTNAYVNFGYNVNTSIIDDYLKYQWQVSRENLFRISEKLNYYVGLLDNDNERFFDKKVVYYQHQVNGSQLPVNISIFQGYLLLSTSKMSKISRFDLHLFHPDSKNRDVLYFKDNTLNAFLTSTNEFLDDLFLAQIQIFKNYGESVYQLSLYLFGIVAVCFICTIYAVFSLKGMSLEIYDSFTKLNEGEFESRFDQLNQLSDSMAFFQESCYFSNLVSRVIQETSREPNMKKTGKRYLDRNYCFGMILPFLTITLFYIFQISISAYNLLQFKNTVSQGFWIGSKQNNLMQTLKNQVLLHSIVKQRLVLGKDSLVGNKSIDSYYDEFAQSFDTDSKKIHGIFQNNQIGDFYLSLAQYLEEKSETSLCEMTPQMTNRKIFCESIDNKIPEKGLVQSYYRITQYYQEIYNEIKRSPNLDPKTFLNDNEFIEVEIAFENIYYWSWTFFSTQTAKFLTQFSSLDVTQTVDFLYNSMIGFIFFSFSLIIIGFIKIVEQVKKIVFSYRLININSVINNTGIRMKFLKVYRLNQKHF